MENQDLISVIVITYNSSDYILETLESIRNQTYGNIEIIISDDGSKDNTMEIIEEWLKCNNERFTFFHISKVLTNTGITPNVNRGVSLATGKYMKLIAGDDLLLPTCLISMYEYCEKNKLHFAYSKVELFTDPFNGAYERRLKLYEDIMYSIFTKKSKQQYRMLLKGFQLYTTGLFIKMDLIAEIGMFNEVYKMMEDYPFAVKVTSQNLKLHLLDSYQVRYRVRTNGNDDDFKKSKRKAIHESDLYVFQNNELIPRMKNERMYSSILSIYINRLSVRIYNSSENIFIKLLGICVSYLSISKVCTRIKMSVLWFKMTYHERTAMEEQK